MNVIRWKQSQPLNGGAPRAALDPWQEFERVLGGLWLEPASANANVAVPVALDVTESKTEYVVRAEVPGIAPDKVEITLHGDVLTIAGEKSAEKTHDQDGWHRSERRFGSFRRSLQLATAVDADKVQAEHAHGVVTITLPKAASALPKRVDVKPAS